MKPEKNKFRFLRPGEIEKAFDEDVVDLDPNQGTTFVYNPNAALSYEQQRQRLPIFNCRNHILYLIEKYQTLVLVGETGCGKSTQLPQYLYEAGWCEDGKQVVVTQPRRVAATTLSARVAEERGCFLGSLVGYSIRFDDCCDDSTRIKYITEGILLREMMADPLLRHYSVIILDEVHEGTLYTDVILGLLKKILKKNTHLKLIVSSATVDAEAIQRFFNLNKTKDKSQDSATIMTVSGRTYPVEIFYAQEPVPDYVQGVVDTIVKIHRSEINGDILAFLTGQEEVERAVQILDDFSGIRGKDGLKLVAVPLHGSLPHRDQLRAFRSAERGHRKAIIATNIAETSVTVRGVCYVVDCGFVKMRWFTADTGTDSLLVVPTSKASAEQRAGRAGRDMPGKVYRLYRENEFELLPKTAPREMQRSELSMAVLQLKALGVHNVLRFNFPSPPPAQHLLLALELLYALGAIKDDGNLTEPLGITMAEFPVHPLFTKTLIAAGDLGCSIEISSVLSMLQVQNIFTKPPGGAAAIKSRVAKRKFEVSEGDLLTLLNVLEAYEKNGNSKKWCYKNFINYKGIKRSLEIRRQMQNLLTKFNVPLLSAGGNEESVRRAITAGFFPNAAYLHHSGVYKSIRSGQQLHIHPSSVLYYLEQPQWLVFCDVVYTDKHYMKNITVTKPQWLEEFAPHFYHRRIVDED